MSARAIFRAGFVKLTPDGMITPGSFVPDPLITSIEGTMFDDLMCIRVDRLRGVDENPFMSEAELEGWLEGAVFYVEAIDERGKVLGKAIYDFEGTAALPFGALVTGEETTVRSSFMLIGVSDIEFGKEIDPDMPKSARVLRIVE